MGVAMTPNELHAELLGMVEYQKEEALPYLPTVTEPDADPIGEWWQLSAEFLEFAIGKPELLAEFLAMKAGKQ
jgi:hypothetical protein